MTRVETCGKLHKQGFLFQFVLLSSLLLKYDFFIRDMSLPGREREWPELLL